MSRKIEVMFNNLITTVQKNRTKWTSWGFTAGIMFAPVMAPLYDEISFTRKVFEILGIAFGAALLATSGSKIIKEPNAWKVIGQELPRIIMGSILVFASLRIFGENTLGEVGYFWVVNLLKEWGS